MKNHWHLLGHTYVRHIERTEDHCTEAISNAQWQKPVLIDKYAPEHLGA